MNVVQIRVPGKIMLAGEYAVLRGGACVACSIEPYLEVRCTSNEAGYRLASTLWQVPRFFSLAQLANTVDREPFVQVVQEAALPLRSNLSCLSKQDLVLLLRFAVACWQPWPFCKGLRSRI